MFERKNQDSSRSNYRTTVRDRAIRKQPDFDPKTHVVLVNGLPVHENDLDKHPTPIDIISVETAT